MEENGPAANPYDYRRPCARPPSAGASFSRCSPAACGKRRRMCPRLWGCCWAKAGTPGAAPAGHGGCGFDLRRGCPLCFRPSIARQPLVLGGQTTESPSAVWRLRAPASSSPTSQPGWASLAPGLPVCLFVHFCNTPCGLDCAEHSSTPSLSF